MGKNLLDSVYTPASQTVRPHWINWLWVVALLCQVGQGMLYWTWSGPDRNRQLVAAKMITEGHGLTEPILDAGTGQIVYEPLLSWAPGYSWVAAVMYPLLHDWGLVSQMITIFAIVLVFGGLRWVIFQIKDWFPWKGEIFLLIMWAIAFTPFQHFTETDLLSLSAALFASGFLIRNLQGDWLVAIAFLFIAAWFRTAYVPFMALPACWLWWKSASWKPSVKVILAGLLTGLTFVSYSWWFSPSHPVSGNVGEMLSAGEFYAENLLSWDAFPVKAWLYVSAEGVGNRFGPLASIMTSGVLIVFSVTFLFRLGKNWLSKNERDSAYPLSTLLMFVMILTCFVLGWLSLRTPREIHEGIRTWTYVQETRYYGWTIILIEIWTIGLFFRDIPQEFTRNIIRFCLLLALAFGIIHGLYRHSSAILFPQHIGTRFANSEQELVSVMEEVRQTSAAETMYLIPGEDIYSRDQVSLGLLEGGILANTREGIPPDAQVIDLRSN